MENWRTGAKNANLFCRVGNKTRDRGAVKENYMQTWGKKKATNFQFGFYCFCINYSNFPFFTSFIRILYPYLSRHGEIRDMLIISELFYPSKYFWLLYICRWVVSVFYLYSIPFARSKKPTKEQWSSSDQKSLVGLTMVSAF